MAFMKVLEINGETLPLPTSYDVEFKDVEAESSGETEAGTTQRDLVRQDVATISVSFSVSKVWLEKLSGYRNQSRLTVRFFSPDTLEYKSAYMYIDGFKAKLEHDPIRVYGQWILCFMSFECPFITHMCYDVRKLAYELKEE